MKSILDSPEVRESLAPMSVESYQTASELGWFDEDVELLEGFPIKKMSKSPLHENLVEELIERLRAALGEDRWVSKERPIQCADSLPDPDIAVFAGRRDFRAANHPTTADLVIEVSVNTLEKDRRKASIYAGADVWEYWIVDPVKQSVLIHRRPSPAGYGEIVEAGRGGLASCDRVPGFLIAVDELFAPS